MRGEVQEGHLLHEHDSEILVLSAHTLEGNVVWSALVTVVSSCRRSAL